MTRPVITRTPPRRSKCRTCGAPTWRLSIGSWGQAIIFNREGNKPLKGGETQHRCAKESS